MVGVGQMQAEVETEAVKETDQISAGKGEGSGAGEGHTEVFPPGRAKPANHTSQTDGKLQCEKRFHLHFSKHVCNAVHGELC